MFDRRRIVKAGIRLRSETERLKRTFNPASVAARPVLLTFRSHTGPGGKGGSAISGCDQDGQRADDCQTRSLSLSTNLPVIEKKGIGLKLERQRDGFALTHA
jgi:hypothetical protein